MNGNGLIFCLFAVGVVIMLIKIMSKKTVNPHPDDPRTREQLRALILGKAKRTVITTRTGYTTNESENAVLSLNMRYKFGKMFEMASKSESGKLSLSNGDMIAPHSREHGLASGRSADKLRIHILKEYGIDIATMEDLEVGDEEFIIQRKAELIAQIQKGMDPTDSPDDSDGFPTEG